MAITHINPATLHSNPVFSNGILVSGGGNLLFVGGQNGTDASGAITGDVAQQSAQATRNVLQVVSEAGGTVENIVKLTIYLVTGADLQAAYTAAIEVWGSHPTTLSMLQVAGLARPEALIELDAVAVIGP